MGSVHTADQGGMSAEAIWEFTLSNQLCNKDTKGLPLFNIKHIVYKVGPPR